MVAAIAGVLWCAYLAGYVALRTSHVLVHVACPGTDAVILGTGTIEYPHWRVLAEAYRPMRWVEQTGWKCLRRVS